MAFKATQLSPDEAYREIKRIARRVDEVAAEAIAALAGDVNADQIIGWAYRLRSRDNQISAVLAAVDVPDLIQYARDQEDDQTYDVQAEFNAMSTQIGEVMSWVQTNFPANGGFLLSHSFGAEGLVPRIFAPASTAGLLTEIQALDASIE